MVVIRPCPVLNTKADPTQLRENAQVYYQRSVANYAFWTYQPIIGSFIVTAPDEQTNDNSELRIYLTRSLAIGDTFFCCVHITQAKDGSSISINYDEWMIDHKSEVSSDGRKSAYDEIEELHRQAEDGEIYLEEIDIEGNEHP